MMPPPPRSTLFPYTTLFRSFLAFAPAVCGLAAWRLVRGRQAVEFAAIVLILLAAAGPAGKSTRLNSSHQIISYAVFCLKKKTSSTRFLLRRNIQQGMNGDRR